MTNQAKANKTSMIKQGMTNITFLLPIRLKKKFKAACAIKGVKHSDVLRKYITNYISKSGLK